MGDFNRDGKLDALIVDGSPALRFLRGNGDGTFARTDIDVGPITTGNVVNLNPSYLSALPHPVDGYFIARAADVNGDGKLDLVCMMVVHLNWTPLSFITVMINTGNDANGNPQFAATHYAIGGYDYRSLTVGDLNGDGKPDFIVGGAYGQVLVYTNNGDGTFTASQTTTVMPNVGGSVGQGVIADVNGDGKADFVVTDGQAGANNIFFGNGDGTLQAPIVQTPVASCVAVADLNGDGKPDLIEGFDGSVAVLLNNGNGTFGSPTLFTMGVSGYPSGLFVSDANGDGKLDVAASIPGAAKVALLTGNGDGTLGAPTLYGQIPNAQDVTLADFTGDGEPEIASVSANGYGGQNFDVLVNTTPFPPPVALFFTDSLTGPSSPNLATIPAGKYGYTASGLQRTQSDNDIDRPVVSTALKTYLASTTGNFAAELTINEVDNDLLYFGLGQGDNDPNYNNEPAHDFIFRVHNNFVNGGAGYYGIQADVEVSGGAFLQVHDIGTYTPGSTITLRIKRAGDQITMSIVGGGSITYSLSAYQSALGLTDANTRVFFGNTTVGSTFSNLKIYPLPSDTTPPVITAPANIVAEATGPSGAVATFTATATDNVDGTVPVTASPVSGSTFPLGVTTVQLTAKDAAGNVATGSFTVTVQDTTPPTLTLPASQTLEATSAAGAVANFAATATDLVTANPTISYSQAPGSTFALGVNTVMVIAKDGAGNIATGSFTVTVRDTTPPVITSLTASPGVLWPPNHKLVPVTLSATATDAVGVTSLHIISATSNEPVNGLGDGNTGEKDDEKDLNKGHNRAVTGDIVITGDLTLLLRAERSGRGNGRIYTITVQASDAAGNTSTRTVTVLVPKSQGDDKEKD